MAKRFIDTNFYKSPFVRGLKGSLKALYTFIICDCDGAGIWVKDLQIASMYIGLEVTEKDFLIFIEKGKAIDLKNGKFFFPDFLEHQYPKGLSFHNPAQKNFILELQKNSIIDSDLKPLYSTFEGAKVMVMEEVEVMEEEKEEVNTQKFSFKNSLKNYGFDEKLINDWLIVRKNKKASNTETAFNKFISEVEKIEKVPINEILGLCVEKSWSGFKAEWFNNINSQTNGRTGTKQQKQHPLTELRAAANQILSEYASQNNRTGD